MAGCSEHFTKRSKPLSFSKHQRLLNAKHFERVFAYTQWRVSHHHGLVLARSNTCDMPRLGLIIAKKHICKAVSRNRIKRLIKESFRHWQHQLPSIDAIVLARKGMDELSNANLQTMMNFLWQDLEKKTKQIKNEKT